MIFVTVGTHPVPFPRLVEWMADWADKHEEPVVIQHGTAACPDTKARCLPFARGPGEIAQLNRRARWVVGHAGVGTIMTSLSHGTPIIVIPRQVARAEHLDDHQVELARELEERGMVAIAQDPRELADLLAGAPPRHVPSIGDGPLLESMRDRIAAIAREREK